MTAPKHVTFFGASVTEQTAHHETGERTGFVNYFIDELAESNGFEVSRVSAGSSDIMDAGVVYVERVIELKPDICVLDWVTPGLMECDPRIVQQVYFRLMAHNILPVTVLLPRTDRVQKDIQISQEMARISTEFNLPFYDVSEMLADIPQETFLRDVVHTNATGARLYAETVRDILNEVQIPATPLPKVQPAFQVMQVLPMSLVPLSSRKVTIDIENYKDGPVNFCVVLEQRVGPYSPVLDVLVAPPKGEAPVHIENNCVFDAWCFRERQCIKRISDWHVVNDLSQISLRISGQTPEIAKELGIPVKPAKERHLKPRGSLYVVADRLLICNAAWA